MMTDVTMAYGLALKEAKETNAKILQDLKALVGELEKDIEETERSFNRTKVVEARMLYNERLDALKPKLTKLRELIKKYARL